jgi:hypothetical protein
LRRGALRVNFPAWKLHKSRQCSAVDARGQPIARYANETTLSRNQARAVMNAKQSDKALQFQELHQRQGVFLIPNPWDAGSVRILTGLGFEAFATSSSACAAVLGRRDHRITRAEALAHVRAIASATDRPVSADLENGFGDDPATVAKTLIELNQR